MSKAKTKAVTPPAPKPATPPPPPDGWQHTPWTLFEDLYTQNQEWFNNLAAKTDYQDVWLATADVPLTEQGKRVTFVIFTAQLDYWKNKARDLEECLQDAGIKSRVPARLFKAALAGVDILARKERSQPVFGGFATVGYNWLADQHRGPDLSRAFGYKGKSFQDLRIASGIAAGPMKGGRGRIFPFHEAMRMLETRLARKRPVLDRRREIAERIWEYVKLRTDLQRREAIRRVLTTTGARCA